MRELLRLFAVFARVGAMTFGGGYAMLPILQREIVEKQQWADEDELNDYFAVAQCTPGIIAVNTATFVGHKRKGVAGGIAATLGVVFPSLLIICVLAGVIGRFSALDTVRHAFAGIRVCVCVLIFNSVCRLWRGAVIDRISAMIFCLILFGALAADWSPVLFVLIAALLGVVLKNTEVSNK